VRKTLSGLVLGLIVGMVAIQLVAASDVTNADYYTRFTISSNSTTPITNQYVAVPLSSPAMIAGNMTNPGITDIALIENSIDVAVMPGYDTNPWMVWLSSIGGNSQVDQYLYSHGATGGKIRTFGTLEIPDTPSLELGDNFTASWSGYVDTATAGNITGKLNAFNLISDGSGNITFATVDSPQQTEVLAPDGVGSSTNITNVQGAATHWESQLTNDTTTSYVGENAVATNWDLYTITDHAVGTGRIDQVVLTFVGGYTGGGAGTGFTTLRTESTNYKGADEALSPWTAYNTAYITNPNTGVEWTWTEVDDLEAGVGLTSNGAFHSSSTQVLVTVYYTVLPAATVTVSSVSTGDLDIIAQSDSTNLWMTVDGSPSANVTFAGVPDNANNIIVGSSATPYWDSLAVTVGGNPIDEWSWQYAATWPGSISGIVGTPTLTTTTSDAHLSATITSQGSTLTPASPTELAGTGWNMIDSVPAEPDNMYGEGGTSFPGGPEINQLATDTRIPYMAWIIPLAFLTSYGGGAMVYAAMHNQRQGRNGSMFVMFIVTTVIYTIWYIGGGGVMPAWPLFVDGIWFFFLMIWFNPFKTAAG